MKSIRAALCRAALCLVMLAGAASQAFAGPPFFTDDPEPVEFRHYEIYAGAEYTHDGDEVSGSLPFVEINFGAAPNLQLSGNLPLAYQRASSTPAAYALTSLEFGAKYRFVPEDAGRPQVSIYPQVVFGSSGPGGNGAPQYFVPLWAQKSYGPWTIFGGGGRWFNAAPPNQDFWFSGLCVQHDLPGGALVGIEVYHSTPEAFNTSDRTGVGAGFIAPIGHHHAILASFGRGIHGDNTFAGYVAYEFMLGPK
ncbi:MAG: hypothetical protein JO293_00565 [Candidatus Eremiobacteraeota bacterium]|nr:hypothetical protein [Candidatus Eremiobacteraeota bacterium]